jgi:RNA polymerase sigma factor (sigma-70 family)
MTATTQANVILRHLRTVVTETTGGPGDRQLLEQFVVGRQQAAFEALVRRHAPLVLAVCRRILRHEHDAEDAFQATFLVLARKAGEVGKQGSLAGWLHRVAYHAALKVREQAANREQHERKAVPRKADDPLEDVTGRELLAVLDEELQRLTETSRAALVLCYLQGHTCDDAARQLGCSVRTLKRRLERGRNCLRARLARRGLALPAAMLAMGVTQPAKAGVPGTLIAATVNASSAALAGTVNAGTAAGVAADAVLHGMNASRFKTLAALLVLAALIVGAGLAGRQDQGQRADAADRGLRPGGAPAEKLPAAPLEKDDDAKKDAISGRVVDADGKSVKGAAVTGLAVLDLGNLSPEAKLKSLGEVKTDEEGRFRLPLNGAPGERFRQFELLAGAKGYGIACGRGLIVGTEIELRLLPEEVVVGRLIDLQGEPAAKANLRAVRVLPDKPRMKLPEGNDENIKRLREQLRRQEAFEFRKDSLLKDSPLWPAVTTTDAEGRFRIGGFGKGQEVHLVVEDDHFARQEIVVRAGAKEERFSLLPAHKVSGRVVAADTDKPVAGAYVSVASYREQMGYGAEARTDAEGRYSINAYPGEKYSVQVFPRQEDPYLPVTRSADWPKGSVHQEANFKLARGVMVRGKVVEAGTGKAVVSAAIAMVPQRENNPDLPPGLITGRTHRVFTDADGAFRMLFPPGRGHLVVTGPNADYPYATVSEGELLAGKVGGPAEHFHAVLPLELKAKEEPKEIKIELRRSVSIKGKVVGPDGKPVKDAMVFLPGELLPARPGPVAIAFGLPVDAKVTALVTKDGTFELPNCDPDKTYRVFVMSGKPEGGGALGVAQQLRVEPLSVANRLIAAKDVAGAVADLSAKAADGKPVEVKLAACESAEVRFVDAKGKPVKQKVWLELLVKGGPSTAKSREEGKPAAEPVALASGHSLRGEKSPVAPDADGLITIPGLIPGATYRIRVLTGDEGRETEVAYEKDFTVEAGKKTKLELAAPLGK